MSNRFFQFFAVLSYGILLTTVGSGAGLNSALPNGSVEVKTNSVSVGFTEAELHGSFYNYSNAKFSEFGFYYGTSRDNLDKWVAGIMDGKQDFYAEIKSLEDGTRYYYMAVVKYGKQSFEGELEEFITFPSSPVDLDLPSGKKWAATNIGAALPTDFGNYYAFAETETNKGQYDWTTYKWAKGSFDKLTKYCSSKDYGYNGFVDGKKVLSDEDDVASVKTSSLQKIPTTGDFQELFENCSISPKTINGVRGTVFQSKKELHNTKKFIFIPYSGWIQGTTQNTPHASLWTSSVETGGYAEYSFRAFYAEISYAGRITSCDRSFGLTIRPIVK